MSDTGKHDRTATGAALVILAALLYGAMNISVKLSASHLSVWQTAMGRFLLGALVIPFLARPLHLDLLGRERRLLILRGLCATAAFVLLIQAIKTIPLSVAIVLFYLWPVFACILSAWVAGEPTTGREWPFVIGAFFGSALILWPEEAGPGVQVGHLLALASSFLAGMAIILIRRLGKTNNAFTIYFYFCLMGALFCLGPLLSRPASVLPASTAGWIGLLAVAVFAMSAQVIMNQGMKTLNASRTGVYMMIEVLAASTFGVLWLSEPFGPKLVAGTILILGCGVALLFLPAPSQSGAGPDRTAGPVADPEA
ncbi:MAG: DMT family transporter [Desulfobacteraceae bacterium]|jgi:drug/metabolite transporter (DMT)-like permease